MKLWLYFAGYCNNFVTIAHLSHAGSRGKILPWNIMKDIQSTSWSHAGPRAPRSRSPGFGLRKAVDGFVLSVERRVFGTLRPSTPPSSLLPAPCSPFAFSLIELLFVMGIIAIMLTLLLPSISGLTSTAGRRGAVNTLMNTFEQSRVAALEAGRPVHVLFARPDFPERDAIMVVRETEDGISPYEQLSKWIKLPKGILLHSPDVGNNLLKAGQANSGLETSRIPGTSPVPVENLGVLTFNETGGISFPSVTAQRKVIVSEGVRGSGGTEALISTKKQGAGGFEIISLSRYTGRSQLDVTTIQ